MEKLRIAFLTDKSYPFYVGGYEVRVHELARRLAETDDVRVYTSLPLAASRLCSVAYQRVSSTRFLRSESGQRSLRHSLLFSLSQLKSPFSSWVPDILVVEAIPYLHLLLMNSWVKRIRSMRILDVCEAWKNYIEVTRITPPLAIGLVEFCLKQGLGWADVVTAISTTTARSLRHNYGIPDRRLLLVPMGIDFDTVPNSIHSEDGKVNPARNFDFVTVGRLVSNKRPDDFVRALGLLKRRTRWSGNAAILGSGPLLGTLRSLVEELGLSRQVIMPGFVDEPTKWRILSRSTAFALPSCREGFSLATLEAMASGCIPIIARPRGWEVFGASDIVRDGVEGLHFPGGNVESLSETLQRIISHDCDIDRMRFEARTTAGRYDWNKIAFAFREDLARLIVS